MSKIPIASGGAVSGGNSSGWGGSGTLRPSSHGQKSGQGWGRTPWTRGGYVLVGDAAARSGIQTS